MTRLFPNNQPTIQKYGTVFEVAKTFTQHHTIVKFPKTLLLSITQLVSKQEMSNLTHLTKLFDRVSIGYVGDHVSV